MRSGFVNLRPARVGDAARRLLEEVGHGQAHAGQRRDVVEVERRPGSSGRDLGAAGHERVEVSRLEVARRESGDGGSPECLGLCGQGTGVGEAVRADVHDDSEGGAARHLEPALGQLASLVEGERVALARAAADEDDADSVGKQVGGLCVDRGELERAVRPERRVCGGDEPVRRRSWFMRPVSRDASRASGPAEAG